MEEYSITPDGANHVRYRAMLTYQKAVRDYIDYNYQHRFDVRTAPDPVAIALHFDKIDAAKKLYLAAEKLHNEKMAEVTPDFAALLRADTKQMRDAGINDRNYIDILRTSDATSKLFKVRVRSNISSR